MPLRTIPRRRAILSILLVAAALLAASSWLDRSAEQTVSAGLKRALVTFAVARAANAAISVLQEVTVSGGAVVVSGSIQPFQFLDPLNDLVEQFSTLMLVASISLGVQRMLLVIGGHVAITVILAAVIVGWLFVAWRSGRSLGWLNRVLVLILFVRFAVPVSAVATEFAFTHFMGGEYSQSQTAVESGARVLDRSAPTDAKSSIDAIQGKTPGLRERAEALVSHVVTLMAIFVLQTILLPIAFAWLTWKVLQWSVRVPIR